MSMIKIGIVGITGFAGFELFKLSYYHPGVSIEYIAARSNIGESINNIFPQIDSNLKIEPIEIEKIDKLDCVFLALPHTVSMELVGKIGKHVRIIDLSADFRIKNREIYKQWYKKEHTQPELLTEAVYGLTEINREKIKTSRIVANPGCYATAVILAVAPIADAIDPDSLIADCKSGVSGAGRATKEGLQFCEVNENFRAYSVASHRHTPEIIQELEQLAKREIKLTFVPHLLPIQRGILATIYCKPKKTTNKQELLHLYREFYKGSPFVRIRDRVPSINDIRGTNFCDIGIEFDINVNRIIIVSVLDNLVKGASGQAVQNLNIMFGMREDEGLKLHPYYP